MCMIMKKILHDKLSLVLNSILMFLSIAFIVYYVLFLAASYKSSIASLMQFENYTLWKGFDANVLNIRPDAITAYNYSSSTNDADISAISDDSDYIISNIAYGYSIEKMNFIYGNGFQNLKEDESEVIIIDKFYAIEKFGYENALGETISYRIDGGDTITLTVIGIIDNDTNYLYKNKNCKESNNEKSCIEDIRFNVYVKEEIFKKIYPYAIQSYILIKDVTVDEFFLIQQILGNKANENAFSYSINLGIMNEFYKYSILNNLIIILIPFITGIFGLITYLLFIISDSEREICMLKFLGIKKKSIILDYLKEIIVRILIIIIPAFIIGAMISVIICGFNNLFLYFDWLFMLRCLIYFIFIISSLCIAIVFIPILIKIMFNTARIKFERSDFNG